MTDQEQREVFAKNLVDVLSEKNETQKDLADAIGETPQTVNTWCKAIALPRMGKVQRLATHLEVPVTRLLDRQASKKVNINEHKDRDFLLEYYALDAYDQGRVDQLIDDLFKKKSGMEDNIDVG